MATVHFSMDEQEATVEAGRIDAQVDYEMGNIQDLTQALENSQRQLEAARFNQPAGQIWFLQGWIQGLQEIQAEQAPYIGSALR